MRVAFLAIGDELLLGESREANAAALAEALAPMGLAIDEVRIVRDALDPVGRALAELAATPTLVLCSGGLGPTDDDGTRHGVAAAAGVALVHHPEVEAELVARYRARGRDFAPSNRRQELFPAGARVLGNDFGTAPGFELAIGAGRVACMPGVPCEFAGMVAAHLADLLAAAGVAGQSVPESCLRVFGITESALQERLIALPGYDAVVIRSLPRFPDIRLMISARGDAADRVAFTAALRADLGAKVFSESPVETYPAAVLRVLAAAGTRLACAESCTGGGVGALMTDAPGASEVFVGGFITYADAAKRDLLGVPAGLLAEQGAVSEAVALAMAEGALARTGATVAVSTTGVAGPGGGSADKPVGTVWIGLADSAGSRAWRFVFHGLDRQRYRELVAWTALERVRRQVLRATGA